MDSMFLAQDLRLLRPDEMTATHRQARGLGQSFSFFTRLAHLATYGWISLDRVREHGFTWPGRPRREKYSLAQLRAHMDEFPFGFFQSPSEATVIGDDVVVGGEGVHG